MTPRFLRSVPLLALAAILAACSGPGPTVRPGSGAPGSPAPSSGAPASSSPSPAGSATPSAGPAAPFDPAAVGVTLEPVVGGLRSPLAVTHAGDGSGRIFVAEQDGAIRIVRDGQLVERRFLDISDRVSAGGERGLLGIAFHPDFPSDPRVFTNYTDTNGDTRISSFALDPGDPDRADAASEVRLLFVEQPYPNHNGGSITFGPDGFLYVATGDGGSGGDPHDNGQTLATLLGKVLRIDVDRTDGAQPYAVPDDNPFIGTGAPEIFAYGLRNPWRMSFDRTTGDLWIGDVGQGAWEEIDVVRAGTSGQNFGWNRMEGAHCFRPAEGCEDPAFVLPVSEYGRDLGSTVIGGNVYRGSAQAGLAGGYVFADFGSGNVWAIVAAGDGPRDPSLVLESDATISSFGEDEVGELYATDLSSGELLHVVAVRR